MILSNILNQEIFQLPQHTLIKNAQATYPSTSQHIILKPNKLKIICKYQENYKNSLMSHLQNNMNEQMYSDSVVAIFMNQQIQKNEDDSNQVNQELERRMGSVKGIQAEIFQRVKFNISKNSANKMTGNQILQKLKPGNNLTSILSNIQTLIPRVQDLSPQFELKQVFQTLQDSSQNMRKVILQLETLFYKIQEVMGRSKKKLYKMCEAIEGLKKTKARVTQFLEEYIVNHVKDDLVKSQEYTNELDEIIVQLQDIQKNDDLAKLNSFSSMQISFFSAQQMSSQNHLIISQSKERIKQLELQQIKLRHEILCYNQKKMKTEKEKGRIENEKQFLEKQFDKIENQIEEIDIQIKDSRDKKKRINIDQLKEDLYKASDEKKKNLISEMGFIVQQQRESLERLNREYDIKQEQIQNFQKETHFIFLIDDSGSMHSKSFRQSILLDKTPFEITKDSIKKFLDNIRVLEAYKNSQISLIKFSDKALVVHSKEPIQSIELVLDKFPQRGGTDFESAFQKASETAQLTSNDQNIILVFLTDGQSIKTKKCEEYLNNIRKLDSCFRMFTLGVGNDIDTNFLQKITLNGNRGIDIMNKGLNDPVPFYQQIWDIKQLSNVFISISQGIDDQIEKMKIQMEFEGKQIKKRKEESEQYFKQQEKLLGDENDSKLKYIEKLENLKNNTEAQEILEEEKGRKSLQKKQISDQLAKIEEEYSFVCEELDKINLEISYLIPKESSKKESTQKQIEQIEIEISQEQSKDQEFLTKQSQFFDKLGYRDQLVIDFWDVGIDGFDNFLKLLLAQTFKMKQFFERFTDIQSDIKIHIAEPDDQSKLSTQGQQESIINKFFQTKEFDQIKTDEKLVKQNRFEYMINQICREEFYTSKDKNDEDTRKLAQRCILESSRSLDIFLASIEYNQENDDRNKSNKKEESKVLKKSKDKLEMFQEEEKNQLEEEISEVAREFYNLNVVSLTTLQDVQDSKSIEKVLRTINKFNFKNPKDKKNKFDCGDDPNEMSELSNEDVKMDDKVENEPKILKPEEVKNITESIKKLLQIQIKLKEKHNNQLEMLESVYQTCVNQLTSIFLSASKLQRSKEIDSIKDSIKKNLIEELDKILLFFQ